jgi:hypothetical protein
MEYQLKLLLVKNNILYYYMNSFILNALDYHNNLKKIEKNAEIKFTDELYNLLPICYIKEKNNYIKKTYNIIGYYEYDSETFIWAWHTNIYTYLYVKTKYLLLHGINTESKTMSDLYVKKLLTTNKIKTTSNNLIEIILSISSYLTKAHYYMIQAEKTNYMVFYVFYDVKDIEELIKNENEN